MTHSLDDPDGDLLSEEEFEETVALPDNLFPVEEVSEATVEKETEENNSPKTTTSVDKKDKFELIKFVKAVHWGPVRPVPCFSQ